MTVLTNFADLEATLEEFMEKLENSADWRARPLAKSQSKHIIRFMFNQMPLTSKEKASLYRKFLKLEVNWIEFYGRCANFSNYEDVQSAMLQPSIFTVFRQPPHTLRNINGMMRPLSYYSLRTWRANVQKISNLESLREASVYNLWDLFTYDLPAGQFTIAEALAQLKPWAETQVTFNLRLPSDPNNP